MDRVFLEKKFTEHFTQSWTIVLVGGGGGGGNQGYSEHSPYNYEGKTYWKSEEVVWESVNKNMQCIQLCQ